MNLTDYTTTPNVMRIYNVSNESRLVLGTLLHPGECTEAEIGLGNTFLSMINDLSWIRTETYYSITIAKLSMIKATTENATDYFNNFVAMLSGGLNNDD